jgi:hypothetical protein
LRLRTVRARPLAPCAVCRAPAPDPGCEGAEAFGLTSGAEREIGAARLEAETPLDEVTPTDIERTDEGFGLRETVVENNRGVFF